MDRKSAGILGACIIVAALVASLLPRLTTGAPGAVRGIHSADGRLAVDYMVQTGPTEAEGSKMERVTDIEFYPNYLVVSYGDGRGRVFFPERTRSLDWTLKPAPPRRPGGVTAKEPAKPDKPPAAKQPSGAGATGP